MLEKIKQVSIIILCLTLSVCVSILTPTTLGTLRKLQETAGEGKRAATAVADYAEFQTEEFQSVRYQKSIKAGIDTGAYANSVLRSINTQVLPQFVRVLKGLEGNTVKLNGLIGSVDDSVRHLDVNINSSDGLLPRTTALVGSLQTLMEKTGATIDEVGEAVKMAAGKMGLSLDAMYNIMADPMWAASLKNVERLTSHAADGAKSVAEAATKAPSIAASLDKIAKTSSRFTRITLIANIVAVLASAFLAR